MVASKAELKCDVKRKQTNKKLKSSSFCYFFLRLCQTESNWKCGNARNQQLEMDPMGEETKFLLLRRTNEPPPPTPPAHRQSDRRWCRLWVEAGISATASTPTTPENPTPTPRKSKQSYCHFNIRKKGVFWFDRRYMATPNENSQVPVNFYGSEINQRNFNYCAWESETNVWTSRATPCSYRPAGTQARRHVAPSYLFYCIMHRGLSWLFLSKFGPNS